MISRRKTILLLVVMLMSFSTNHLLVFALEMDAIPIIEEIDLPQDLNFTVSNTCSRHAYFMQAAADETGCYLIYSRHINPDDYSDVDFEQVYIDIYNSDGGFLQELSFKTPLDCAVELKEGTVNIYFYTSVLTYDLATREVHHYAIPEGSAVNGDMYKQLRSPKFTAGNWEYSYKKGFNGYVKLLRSDGEQVQVLVEMSGTGNFFWKVIFPGAVIGIIVMIIIVWRFKSSTGHSTGDGGAC